MLVDHIRHIGEIYRFIFFNILIGISHLYFFFIKKNSFLIEINNKFYKTIYINNDFLEIDLGKKKELDHLNRRPLNRFDENLFK